MRLQFRDRHLQADPCDTGLMSPYGIRAGHLRTVRPAGHFDSGQLGRRIVALRQETTVLHFIQTTVWTRTLQSCGYSTAFPSFASNGGI